MYNVVVATHCFQFLNLPDSFYTIFLFCLFIYRFSDDINETRDQMMWCNGIIYEQGSPQKWTEVTTHTRIMPQIWYYVLSTMLGCTEQCPSTPKIWIKHETKFQLICLYSEPPQNPKHWLHIRVTLLWPKSGPLSESNKFTEMRRTKLVHISSLAHSGFPSH